MQDQNIQNYIKGVLKNMPSDWLNLTTHRLDIYNEKLAKTDFINQFEILFNNNNSQASALKALPTAYDYIRLGHPLSSVFEWAIAKIYNIHPSHVISFSSQAMPILAVLRKNLLDNKKTLIVYKDELPKNFTTELLKRVYGYNFEIKQTENIDAIPEFNGSVVFISNEEKISTNHLNPNIDFYINLYENLGSVILINGEQNKNYVSEIQHVRRRESIAMTPQNTLVALNALVENSTIKRPNNNREANKQRVLESIKTITATTGQPLVGSSGLSIQYAIMMGLIDDAQQNHQGKAIKFIVPTNCYGGTNDQARRVAACNENVEIVDLEVDGDNDMVSSLKTVLDAIAKQDAIPYIIAEIPTNPRVEVPDLEELKAVLAKDRKTDAGANATQPVFILDQTFCPNIQFLAEDEILASGKALSYASGSKFPSGGKCTAGYCVGNKNSEQLMEKIAIHLSLCDNEATDFQYEVLAEQMPSMNQRIDDAYKNTREFVDYISEKLPEAKINFVSEELAARGFTPSVFSLDLPTKGDTEEEREAYKRQLNHKLINMMITKIPNESKYCVSYGQLKGCYWTIPATSTQGTTKEGHKDYIARVALSGNMDLERHKAVFLEFVESI
ncbi:Cys/Met metabolism PLP-dependent enzyme [Winogradskyella wandonensis]|uniref:Cys/Met metabolism PLP-dependent enzyme n=1 Tax=Winogradskyella wandonensis TaxID=1442586 RepID=A0A4R1KTS7_9FLAO|nr:PLP-dependent transferase [Winogradskyella wandonensis]TCK68554.1 Cys/Met metabolism PLP-dependent enzyme [Winogradskyella wandonensis]